LALRALNYFLMHLLHLMLIRGPQSCKVGIGIKCIKLFFNALNALNANSRPAVLALSPSNFLFNASNANKY